MSANDTLFKPEGKQLEWADHYYIEVLNGKVISYHNAEIYVPVRRDIASIIEEHYKQSVKNELNEPLYDIEGKPIY